MVIKEADRVFVSHTGKNKAFARELGSILAAHGVTVFFDEWSIELGQSIVEAVNKGLTTCNWFVLAWSKHASQSPWVQREMSGLLHTWLRENPGRVVPILLDTTPLPPLFADFKGIKSRDPKEVADRLVGPGAEEAGIRKTIVALNERREELLRRGMGAHGRCSTCGSSNVGAGVIPHPNRDAVYEFTRCADCGKVLDECYG